MQIRMRLLNEYDRSDAAWVEDVREKIDAAISASDQTPPIEGENFVSQVLERFQQAGQTQK